MKTRPHCFLRPILRPAAVFALAFGVTSLMLSAQEEDAAPDVDEAVTEAVEVTESDSEEAVEAEDGETAEEAAEAEDGEAQEGLHGEEGRD